jgi:hypothetical protein
MALRMNGREADMRRRRIETALRSGCSSKIMRERFGLSQEQCKELRAALGLPDASSAAGRWQG